MSISAIQNTPALPTRAVAPVAAPSTDQNNQQPTYNETINFNNNISVTSQGAIGIYIAQEVQINANDVNLNVTDNITNNITVNQTSAGAVSNLPQYDASLTAAQNEANLKAWLKKMLDKALAAYEATLKNDQKPVTTSLAA